MSKTTEEVNVYLKTRRGWLKIDPENLAIRAGKSMKQAQNWQEIFEALQVQNTKPSLWHKFVNWWLSLFANKESVGVQA